mmetsp:Transcript_31132/g.46239  ORF Transcript_31132/g.46239 Transcript_31132/m.46239 type:complete len:123 (-) Transcript_31132:1097-1465(-)
MDVKLVVNMLSEFFGIKLGMRYFSIRAKAPKYALQTEMETEPRYQDRDGWLLMHLGIAMRMLHSIYQSGKNEYPFGLKLFGVKLARTQLSLSDTSSTRFFSMTQGTHQYSNFSSLQAILTLT